jgi:hypothetical protein
MRVGALVKIALGMGHRVLGSQWTFGPGGDLLRSGLWARLCTITLLPIRDNVNDLVRHILGPILGIAGHKHVMAVLPNSEETVAIIALFGGAAGQWTINLETNSRAFFENFEDEPRGGCVFGIPPSLEVSQRRLVSQTIRQVADEAERGGLLYAREARSLMAVNTPRFEAGHSVSVLGCNPCVSKR